MTVATPCDVHVHVWLLAPTWLRKEGEPAGHCTICGVPIPPERADNRPRREHFSQKQQALQNSKVRMQLGKEPNVFRLPDGDWKMKIVRNGVIHEQRCTSKEAAIAVRDEVLREMGEGA